MRYWLPIYTEAATRPYAFHDFRTPSHPQIISTKSQYEKDPWLRISAMCVCKYTHEKGRIWLPGHVNGWYTNYATNFFGFWESNLLEALAHVLNGDTYTVSLVESVDKPEPYYEIRPPKTQMELALDQYLEIDPGWVSLQQNLATLRLCNT